MDIDKIIFDVEYLITESFELIDSFDLNKARNVYKKFKTLNSLVDILIQRCETTIKLSNANITSYYTYLIKLKAFLTEILKFEIKTKIGFKMFIHNVTSYNFDNTI